MHREFRQLAIEEIAKSAGVLTSAVQNKLKTQARYKPIGISLGIPGTSVIAPSNIIDTAIKTGKVNILFFFRGGSAGLMSKSNTNAITVLAEAGGLGGGKSREAYGNAGFINRAVSIILSEVNKKVAQAGGQKVSLGHLGLAGWSGGYDPIHAILEESHKGSLVKKPDYIGVFDGMHHGKPNKINETAMSIWEKEAERARKGESNFVVTHTAVVPGRYASSTDTSNYLLSKMNMKRTPATSGPAVSVAQSGGFQVAQLYDKEAPYMLRDENGNLKPNVPGTSGAQHINALKAVPAYMPDWA